MKDKADKKSLAFALYHGKFYIEMSTVKEAFGKNDILSDNAALFYDEDFWGDYNIIQPEESLEKAVGKLRKRK